jgi:cytochrome c5
VSYLLKRIIILLLLVISPVVIANLSGSLAPDAIDKRLKPAAQVEISGESLVAAPTGQQARTGEQVYNGNCIDCHKTGVAGAPKIGDKAAWAPRVAQGKETLFQYAWHGLRAMPPKGNCLDCNEDEIRKAIDYMLSK